MARKEDPVRWELISEMLLELTANDSEAMEDTLARDEVSNFNSPIMLPKALDSIMEDLMARWAEVEDDEKDDDDDSTVQVSLFMAVEELDEDDSLKLDLVEPVECPPRQTCLLTSRVADKRFQNRNRQFGLQIEFEHFFQGKKKIFFLIAHPHSTHLRLVAHLEVQRAFHGKR